MWRRKERGERKRGGGNNRGLNTQESNPSLLPILPGLASGTPLFRSPPARPPINKTCERGTLKSAECDIVRPKVPSPQPSQLRRKGISPPQMAAAGIPFAPPLSSSKAGIFSTISLFSAVLILVLPSFLFSAEKKKQIVMHITTLLIA